MEPAIQKDIQANLLQAVLRITAITLVIKPTPKSATNNAPTIFSSQLGIATPENAIANKYNPLAAVVDPIAIFTISGTGNRRLGVA